MKIANILQIQYLSVIFYIFIYVFACSAVAKENSPHAIISEENLLVVALAVEQNTLDDNIEIYQHEGGFLVPLGFLTAFMDFPIEVNIENAQAYGWFIKENRNFLLDIRKNTVIIAGKETPVGNGIIVTGADDIYVDSSLFSKWFPVDLELDFSHLLLKLHAREKLAFQEKSDRNNRHSRLIKADKKQNNYPTINTPPAGFTVPFIDVDLGNQYDTKATPKNKANFSMLAQSDTLQHSTNVFLAGDTADSMTSARFKAGNKDKDAGLLGPLHATEYFIGDIDGIALPLVSRAGHGYGAFIANTDLSRPDQFDLTNFVGNSQPGWEVELYRNGELLEFQLVSVDGRYEFNNIPILYGNNNFKIVSYGPQGQVKEEIKNYTIDESITKKGKFNYRLALDEKSQSLLGIDEQDINIMHNKQARFVSDFEYGLLDTVTVSSGLVSTPLEDKKTHNYQTVGIKSNVWGTLSAVNAAYDYENKGVAAKAAVNTSIKDVSMRFEHKQFNNFVSEEELTTNVQHKWASKLDFYGQFNTILPAGITYALGAQTEKFTNNSDITTFSNRLATSLYGIGFGNNLQWHETKTIENNNIAQTGDGSFSIRGSYKHIFLRISTDYAFSPVAEINAVNLSAQKELSNNYNLRFDIKKDLGSTSLTSVNTSLNKEFKNYRLSTIISADTNDAYTLGVLLSFALGYNNVNNQWFSKNRSIANEGAISASAFLDKNYNNIYDADDALLENISFESGNKKYDTASGDKPAVLINSVTPYVPADVKINLASLEDPYLTPEISGYNVTTRPGVITAVNFPVHFTTEIDGIVYNNKDNKIRQLSRAVLELQDSNGKVVNTTKSEYDGFYVFSDVIPGEYSITLAKETIEKLAIKDVPHILVNIPQNSDVISGIDITINDVAP